MANEVGTAYVDVAFDNRQVDREVSGLGSSMAGSFKRIAGVVAGAFVLDKVVGGIHDSINAASDLNETVSKTGQVFKSSAPAMVKWGATAATSIGLSQTAALDGAASIGAMLVPMGVAPKHAAVMSRSMTQLAGDMASFNNEDPSDMLDRIRAGLSGESEPLKRFGTVLSETRVQQFAWANGIADTGKKLTEQQKIQARYGLLLKDTATQQGDFARTSGGLANQQRILRAELDNASASLGKALLPAAVAVVHALVGAVPVVLAFGQAVIDKVGPPLQDVADIVAQHWPQIRSTIVSVVSAITGAFDLLTGSSKSSTGQVGSAFINVRAVIDTVGHAIGAVLREVQSIVQSVAAGIRAHSAEISATMQSLRSIFNAVWPAISRIVETAWTVIKLEVQTALRVVGDVIRAVMAIVRGDWGTAWSAIGDIPKAILSGAIGAIKAVLTGAVPAVASLALRVATAIVRSIGDGLATLASIVGRAIADGVKGAVSAAIGLAQAVAPAIGSAIVAGLLGGLGGLLPSLASSLKDKIGGAIGWVKGHLGSTAEEHAASELGHPIARGVELGWIMGTRELPSKLADTVKSAIDAAVRTVDASKGRLTDAWGTLSSDLDAAFAAVWSKPTASETALAKLQQQAADARITMAIDDARASLATAQAGKDGKVDPVAVVQAQRQLDDALLAEREASLSAQAQLERREADANAQLQQRNFDAALARLQAHLTAQGATHGEAQKAVLALLKKYGVQYGDVGELLGSSFVTQLKGSLAGAVKAARDVADDVEAALDRVNRAANAAASKSKAKGASGLAAAAVSPVSPLAAAAGGPGPLAAGPSGAGLGGGGGLAGEVSPTRLLAAALSRAVSGVQPSAPASLDGVEVRVFVGDTELRGIVRHEVVQHDAGVAEVLAAGAA